MRRALALVALLAACAGPPATERFLEGSFEIPADLVTTAVPTESMRYLMWFPAGYEPGADLPLVVFLHGSGDPDYDSAWLTAYGLPAVLRFEDVPADDFVLIAPQAAPGTSWGQGRQPETVMALVDDVLDRFGLADDRVSLTGLSMGGYGAWHLASRFPDRFATVASVSGSGYGFADLPTDLDVCALADVDLRGYHGGEDLISLPDLNRRVVDLWEERCGAPVDFRVIPDAGHFETFGRIYRDPAFYEWFLMD